MDELIQKGLELLKDPAYREYALQGLAAIGFTAILPKVLAKSTPFVLKAADRLADVLLRIPILRDLILLFADDIIATLDATSNGIEMLVATFSNRLEERIKSAKAADDAANAPVGRGRSAPPDPGLPPTKPHNAMNADLPKDPPGFRPPEVP